jgi:hypothetical protein
MSGRWETTTASEKQSEVFRVYNVFPILIILNVYFDALSGKMPIVNIFYM